jgi:protein-disulfide isomerase
MQGSKLKRDLVRTVMLVCVSRNRLLLVVGAVAAAAVIAVVAIVVGTGSGGSGTVTTVASGTTSGGGSTGASAGPVTVLKGVPQHGTMLGSASAPATIQVFEDPQCPYCQEWAIGTLPSVVQQYVRTGKVNLVYNGVEIIGPNSAVGLRAIYAAGRQNKLWNLVEELYTRQGEENSGWITPAVIRSSATAVGADPAAVAAASVSAGVKSQMKQAEAAFAAVGAPGTPTFVVERPPARAVVLQLTGLDPASFDAALDSALQ